MSEIQYAWVIQRDDGQYLVGGCLVVPMWSDSVRNCELFEHIEPAIVLIQHLNLKKCKPVKIEMRVVEDEKETN